MDKILIPIDGSKIGLRAVEFVVGQAGRGQASMPVLLNVQLPILSGDIRQFVSQELIDKYCQEEGDKALAAARALLDAAGVPYEHYVRSGHIAETIVAFAKEKGCQSIVMSGHGQGSVMGMLLGSVTTKVLCLASMPVTVVK